MINLLRGEFFKLFRMKSLYILLFISIAVCLLNVGTFKFITNLASSKTDSNVTLDASEDTSVSGSSDTSGLTGSTVSSIKFMQDPSAVNYLQMDTVSSNFDMLILILVSLFIVSEFTSGSMKMIVSKGVSKWKLYMSKYIAITVISIFIYLIDVLVDFIMASILWKVGDFSGNTGMNIFTFILISVLILIGVTAVGLMFGQLLRNNGGAIAINILIALFSGLIFAAIDLFTKSKIAQYWLFNLPSDVGFDMPGKTITRIVVMSIIYIVGSIAIGIITFQKREIK